MRPFLIPLSFARSRLRLDDCSCEDADLLLIIQQASDVVIDYIKRPEHGWTEFTCPPIIQLAILRVVGNIFANRDNPDAVLLSNDVKDILTRQRDLTLR